MNYKWYSVCSRHDGVINLDCAACSTGHWVDEDSPEVIADRKLWNEDPDGWREKHASDRLVFQHITDVPL